MLCKRIFLGLFLITAFIFLCTFGNAKTVKADNEPTITMTDGASIRTLEPAGLRFTAELSGDFSGTSVTYGFIFLKGDISRSHMIERFEAGTAGVIEVTPDGNTLAASVVNIPSSGFETDLTALAYADIDGTKVYGNAPTARNIKEVAEAAVLNGESNDFLSSIVNVSTLNLDGGRFVTTRYNITAYNAGNSYADKLTLGDKANGSKAVGLYWRKLFLKATSIDPHLFTIVKTSPSGEGYSTATEGLDYDYVIGAAQSNSSNYSMLTTIGNNENNYVHLSSFNSSCVVTVSENYNLLLSNKILLEDGDPLPNAEKDYYTFDGWYDNSGFIGDSVTTKSGNTPETFYAKYTPVNYTLTYHLQDGLCGGESSLDPVVFTVESSEIVLPLAGTMTREDYEFVEWNTRSDASGDAITSIPHGSHGNIDVYAIWASAAPTVVSLSSAEEAIFESITPTKFVSHDFTAGKFTIGTLGTFKVGEGELFTSIAAANSAASANDVIYIFAGTYAEEGQITISVSNVKFIGPNYGNHANSASPSREPEANMSSGLLYSARGFTLDGIQLSGSAAFHVYGSNYTVQNCYITSNGQKIYSNSEIMMFGGDTSNINVRYNYIGASNSVRPIRNEGYTMTNFNFEYNYCYGTNQKYDFIRFKNIAGTFNFNNNVTNVKCSDWIINIKTSCAGATINVKDNQMTGGANNSGISFTGATAATTINFIGNLVDLGGTRLKIAGSTNAVNIDISYNKFRCTDGANTKIAVAAAETNVTIHHNYSVNAYVTASGGTITTASTDDFASEAELDEAYALLP